MKWSKTGFRAFAVKILYKRERKLSNGLVFPEKSKGSMKMINVVFYYVLCFIDKNYNGEGGYLE